MTNLAEAILSDGPLDGQPCVVLGLHFSFYVGKQKKIKNNGASSVDKLLFRRLMFECTMTATRVYYCTRYHFPLLKLFYAIGKMLQYTRRWTAFCAWCMMWQLSTSQSGLILRRSGSMIYYGVKGLVFC